jgi:hypothetical protein
MTQENTETSATSTTLENPTETPDVPHTPVQERMSEEDRLTLELIKEKRATALESAKLALANNEKAELAYKYCVLQLYMKYHLTAADALNESGEIIRGGAIPQKK